jgi:hypothetical protein
MLLLVCAEVVEKVRNVEYPPFRPRVTVEEAGSTEMLELMMSCWDEEPSLRPSFDTIKELLKKTTRGKSVLLTLSLFTFFTTSNYTQFEKTSVRMFFLT